MQKAGLLLLACQVASGERLGYGRAAADPFFATYTDAAAAEIYEAPLDHFNATDTRTVEIRYWVDDSCLTPGGPLFVRMGGEGASGRARCGTREKKFGAAVLSLEHRFYGESLPKNHTEPLSNEHLAFLTVEQNLADTSDIVMLVEKRLASSKVVAFGGSYSGATCAWFKQKYPVLVNGCISSSGVINTILDLSAWDARVRTALMTPPQTPGCGVQLRAAITALETKFAAGKGDDMKRAFGAENLIGTPFGDEDFFFAVSDGAQSLDQYGNKAALCDNLAKLPANPTDDERIDSIRHIVETYQGKTFVGGHYYDTEKLKYDTSTTGAGVGNRQWRWQKCHETGYLQSAPAENSLRSVKYNNFPILLSQCAYMFNTTTAAVTEMNANFTKQFYHEAASSSNTFFINYSDDPWQEASTTQPLGPTLETCMVTCDGCGHCGAGAGSAADACDDAATERIGRYLS